MKQVTTIRFSIKNLICVLLMFAALYITYKSRSVLLVTCFGILIAYIVNPVVEKLIKIKIPRVIAVLSVVLLLGVVVVFSGFWVFPEIYRDIELLIRNIPVYVDKIAEILNLIGERIGVDLSKTSIYNYGLTWMKGSGQRVISWMGGIAGSVKYAFEFTMNLIIAPVIAFIILADYPGVTAFVDKYIGIDTKLRYSVNVTGSVMSAYFRGQLIVVIILSILYSVTLMIIGVDAALLLGLLTGVLSMVPYLGFSVGIIASVLVTAVQFQDITHVVYIIIGYGVVQMLESFVITPRIVGSSVGLHPAATMVVLLVGGASFGLIGMIFAIPLSAAIFKLYKVRHAQKEDVVNTGAFSVALDPDERMSLEKIIQDEFKDDTKDQTDTNKKRNGEVK